MPHTRHPSSQRDPRVRSLLKLSTSSASWPRSLSGIYIYIHTPLLSLLLLSRASLVYDVSLCLSRFLVSPSRFSPEHPRRVGGSCHVHSIFYFLYRVATSFNVSRRFILRRIYRSRWCCFDRRTGLFRLLFMEVDVISGWRLIETRKYTMVWILWWIQVRIDLREVAGRAFYAWNGISING